MTLLYRAIWADRVEGDAAERVAEARECLGLWALPEGAGTELPEGVMHTTREVRRGGVAFETPRSITLSARQDGLGFYARVRDYPHAADADQTMWTVDTMVTVHEGVLHVAVELAMDTESPMQPVAVGRPGVVDDLLACALAPKLGKSNIVDHVLDVEAAAIEALVEHLQDEERALPVILFTEPIHDPGSRWKAWAEATMTRTRGIAVVARLDVAAVHAFRARLGDLAVWDGAVRTYMPTPVEEGDGWRHRYVPALRVRAVGGRIVDMVIPPVAALSARRRLPAPLAQMVLGPVTFSEDARAREEEMLGRVIALETELENERLEREEIENQFMRANGHLGRIIGRLRERDETEIYWESKNVGENDLPDSVENVSGAVAVAQLDLAEWVTIPDSACKQLESLDVTPNATAWGNTTLRGLRALAQYAQDRKRGEPGDFWNWCKNSGNPLAWPASAKKLAMQESSTVMARKRHLQDRTFPIDRAVNGKAEIVMVAHLKISEGGASNIPRVYFYDDTNGNTGRIHVGFIGPHYLVRNSKS